MFRGVVFAIFLCAGCALSGQTTDLVVGEKTLVLPIPGGYAERAREAGQPAHAAVFETTKIEEWERINEFNEEILILGFEYAKDDQASINAKFEALFNNVVGFAQANADNVGFSPSDTIAQMGTYNWLTTRTAAAVAQKVTVTENTLTKKSVEIIAGLELVGVVTYPVVAEISFVLLGDRMIIAEAKRVNFDDGVPGALRATGVAFREGITVLNPDTE